MSGETNRSLARAFAVLEFLAAHGSRRLSEIAAGVELAPPTALRMLRSLQDLGYASQDEGRWRLTGRLRCLMPDGGETAYVQRHLDRLAAESGQTAFMVVPQGDEALYLQRALPPESALIATTRIGRRAPLYCTGVGKVLLAGRSDEAVERYLVQHRLKQLTPGTISTRNALRAAVARIREVGFGLDQEECEAGVFCVAVPVRDASGAVRAALSVSGARASFDERRLEPVVARLRECAEALSSEVDLDHLR